jgi:hypothetical protein
MMESESATPRIPSYTMLNQFGPPLIITTGYLKIYYHIILQLPHYWKQSICNISVFPVTFLITFDRTCFCLGTDDATLLNW